MSNASLDAFCDPKNCDLNSYSSNGGNIIECRSEKAVAFMQAFVSGNSANLLELIEDIWPFPVYQWDGEDDGIIEYLDKCFDKARADGLVVWSEFGAFDIPGVSEEFRKDVWTEGDPEKIEAHLEALLETPEAAAMRREINGGDQ